MPTQRLHAWLDPATAVPGPPGLPRVLYDEGVALPVRTVIDMRGAGVSATDDEANDTTVVTIPGHTPWTGDVDAADFSLLNVTSLHFADGTVQSTAPSLSYGGAGRTDVLLPRRPVIRFSGDGVTVTDNDVAERTEVVIPGAAATDWVDITNKPSSFPPDPHTHPWTEVTSKPLVFPPEAHQHPWGDITGTPSSFPPAAHVHAAADVTSGVFAVARLGSGTGSAGNYLRGDGAWTALTAAQVSGVVPNTTQVIAGTGLSGGGALSGNVTLSANIAGIQSPWTQHISGAGYRLDNAGSIRSTGYVEVPADKAVCCNLTFDGSNWRYIANGPGLLLLANVFDGSSRIMSAPAGAAGAVATPVDAIRFSSSDAILRGKLAVNSTAVSYRPLGVADSSRPYTDSAAGGGAVSIGIGTGQTDDAMLFGFNSAAAQPYGWIQAIKAGTGNRILMLNPNGGHLIQSVPAGGLADWGSLANNTMSMFLNEAGNQITFHVKYSNGTVKAGTVALA